MFLWRMRYFVISSWQGSAGFRSFHRGQTGTAAPTSTHISPLTGDNTGLPLTLLLGVPHSFSSRTAARPHCCIPQPRFQGPIALGLGSHSPGFGVPQPWFQGIIAHFVLGGDG